MGKASITIAVSSVFNGSGFDKAIESATKLSSKLSRMEKLTAANSNSMAQNVGKMGLEWEAAGRRIEQTGKKIADVGDNLTKSVTLPMLTVGAYAGKMAVDFDTALANVRKTSDLTEMELEGLAQSALKLSQTQPVSAETILNVEALGAQLGISKGKLESFATVVTGLDIATNMNAETAGTELARFANIVGMSEDKYENFGSTLVAIGNNMATTESEVSQMAMRFASAGAQAGMSEAQILGMAGAMSSLGIKAEMGGSALSQIFVSIGKAVANGGDDLEAFASRANMSADEFRRAWGEDAASAFNALIEGIGGATAAGEDMNVIMGELGFTQIRQSDVMRRLAGSTEAVTGKTSVLSDALKLSTEAWESNTALQKEVDQRNESMASRLQVLKNKIDAIAITVGRPLVDAVIDALGAFEPLIQSVAKAAQAFADMDEEGQRNILMWAGFAAAAGPVLSVTGRMTEGVGHLVREFGESTSKIAVLTDAMNGLDGANLRTYASSKSHASALGLAKNAAVQAAGGVENYVKAWDDMNIAAGKAKKAENAMNEALKAASTETGAAAANLLKKASAHESDMIAAEADYKANAKLVTAFGNSTREAEKAADGIKALEPALQQVKIGTTDNAKVLADYNKTLKTAGNTAKGASITFGQGLANGARLAASSIGNFIKACAPMLAISAAVTAVTAVVSLLAENARKAAEHQKLLSDASSTFASISGAAAAGAKSQAEGIGSIAEKAREAIEGVKAMNEQAAQTMAEFETSSATLDEYTNALVTLGNKGSLTALEQEKLKVAVDGYNKITGNSIEITDESTGALSKSSDEIRENTKAWKENAEAQALQSVAQGYIEKRVQAELALSQATDAYSRQASVVQSLEERRSQITDKNSMAYRDLTGQITIAESELKKLEPAVNEASAAFESASLSEQQAAGRLALLSEEGQTFRNTVAGMPEVVAVFDQMGISIDSFSSALLGVGVKTEQLNSVGSANIAALATAFNGNINQMAWAIQNYNTVPIVNKDGSVNINSAQLIDAQGKVYTWNETGLADQYGVAVAEYTQLQDAQGNVYTWNKSKLSPKNATATANTKEVAEGTDNIRKYNQTTPKNHKATATVGYGTVSSAYKANKKYNDNPPKTFTASSTINKYINTYETTIKRTRVESAAGGIALHAAGGIATRATDITRHIAGEAGAEAIVPLTNRHYVTPFAQVVAQETVAAMRGGRATERGGNTYVININGAQARSMTHRQQDALMALIEEFDLTNNMGVL